MSMYELIKRKRDGESLSDSEISQLVHGITSGAVPDYQIAAWLMAVYFRGMTPAETVAYTQALVASGETLSLADIPGIKVDKHSSGGVGDKTTLVVAPLVAACGVPVAKLSGRGLGHTGGTLDKLESFAGFRVDLNREQFIAQVKCIGLALAGQSANLVPADKKLYALRDVTATVDSIPLIAASIMSKKLAAGSDSFVLDVKAGRGAFMPDKASAAELAAVMVDIASRYDKKAVALVTAMDNPLGRAVGNALEVKEAIAALRGEGPEDLLELTLALAAEMLALAGKAPDAAAARPLALAALQSGRALEMLARMVAAQGGATDAIDHPELLPQAPLQLEVLLNSSGYITSIDAMEIGLAVMQLGAGRQTKDDAIDLAVGVELLRKPGELAVAHEPVAIVHARTPDAATQAVVRIARAYSLQPGPLLRHSIVLERITQHT